SVLLDISRSMKFSSRGIPKIEYACFVGACLAYLAQRQRDRVGLVTFDNDIVDHVPPSSPTRFSRRSSRSGSSATI
ncbi:MAG: hypothetical protein JF610_10160, partial [Acidobacteria bacterium]|nr:hypothetical protein [Acidobacteriota bacterium]